MYENGRGVEKNHAKEVEWHEKAAEKGHAAEWLSLRDMSANGPVVKKDIATAVEPYTQVVAQVSLFGGIFSWPVNTARPPIDPLNGSGKKND